MSSYLTEFVTRCLTCGWLFRHTNPDRLRCTACESKQR